MILDVQDEDIIVEHLKEAGVGHRYAVNTTQQGKYCKGPFTQAIFVAQFSAIFVALKMQLQSGTCKPAAISVRF